MNSRRWEDDLSAIKSGGAPEHTVVVRLRCRSDDSWTPKSILGMITEPSSKNCWLDVMPVPDDGRPVISVPLLDAAGIPNEAFRATAFGELSAGRGVAVLGPGKVGFRWPAGPAEQPLQQGRMRKRIAGAK